MQKIMKNPKIIIAYIHDIVAVLFAWILAYILRFNFYIPEYYLQQVFQVLPYLIIPQSIFFIFIGLYRGLWRFASLSDLKRIIFGAFFSLLLVIILSQFFNIPRSIILLFPILLIFALGINRFLYRFFKEGNFLKNKYAKPILIIGAGSSGKALSKELALNNEFNIIGFLDNDLSLHGRKINDIKILGGIDFLYEAVKVYKIKDIILTIPQNHKKNRKHVLDLATNLNLKVLIAPTVDELVSGEITFSRLRSVDVVDILGRDLINLNTKKIKEEICGKTILLTGAGGSVGSELCRQIIQFRPKKIICFDISELALYKLEQLVSKVKTRTDFIFLLGDVRNTNQIERILKKYHPNIVYHAAAYKHVPMLENENIPEVFSNNVEGTYRLALRCKKNMVDKFILVSTDKAVNPTNVMGATKRLAEMVCEGLQDSSGTNFVIVRFGNVLDSSGSVIPKFRNQIVEGGPITVTDPKITRFFMALPEASQLVIQSSVMGSGGEIFVLDMGEPVKILDLAKSMIKLSGLTEDDIKIKFIGLRPGEKLYEEILIGGENILPTRHNKIFIAKTKRVSMDWVNSLILWLQDIPTKKENTVKRELKKWVVEYKKQ